ncbi:MAG: hypothetical protein JXX14_18930 [Deltaproteobacteria bacterium]|nr:hypothetical protein [Deltaproteobacteria bacterium]
MNQLKNCVLPRLNKLPPFIWTWRRIGFALLVILATACTPEQQAAKPPTPSQAQPEHQKNLRAKGLSEKPPVKSLPVAAGTNSAQACASRIDEKTGAVLFKVVMFGYAGTVDAAGQFYKALPKALRLRHDEFPENDGWRLSRSEYLLPEKYSLNGRRVAIHLWSHEGIGFIGQPGHAKDTVFRNATGIIAAGNNSEASDLMGVLDTELVRVSNGGQRHNIIFCAPGDNPPPDAFALSKAHTAAGRVKIINVNCLTHPQIALSQMASMIGTGCL